MLNIFTLLFFFTILFSCKRDNGIELNSYNKILKSRSFLKTPELQNYQAALDEISLPKYFKGQAETTNHMELSPEKRKIMLEPSLKLIYSTGISKAQLTEQTKFNEIEIVNLAFRIYKNQIDIQ